MVFQANSLYILHSDPLLFLVEVKKKNESDLHALWEKATYVQLLYS